MQHRAAAPPDGAHEQISTPVYDPDGSALVQTRVTQVGAAAPYTAVLTTTVNAQDAPLTTTDSGYRSGSSSGAPLTTRQGYDAAGQVRSQSVLTSSIPVTSTLDAQGRTTALSESLDGLTTPYSVTWGYNGNDQPVSQTLPGGEQYTYRADGQLGQVAVISGTTGYTDTYLYDPHGSPLELLRQYAGQAVQRYWYALDGRGNVVVLTNITGTVVDRYGYDAWGVPTLVQESVPQRLRYGGYWWDAELGWYWVSVRHYSPSLRRWLAPDPSQQDGVRTYVYVGDDPVDRSDPSGDAPVGSSDPGAGTNTLPLPTPSLALKPTTKKDWLIIHVSTVGGSIEPSNGNNEPPHSGDAQFLKTVGDIADHFGVTIKQVNDAIHAEKQGELGGGKRDNPDVVVDQKTGEIYPVNEDGSLGDSIGNLHEGLASDKSGRKRDKARGRERRPRSGDDWGAIIIHDVAIGAAVGSAVIVVWWVDTNLTSSLCGSSSLACA